VATPGNQPAEIVRVLKLLSPHYEQTVLLGYPPFLKDLVDTAPQLGFSWPAGKVRLVTAGEVFSEEWRSLVCRRLGAAHPEQDTASLYGTADGGVLACETPTSIAIRRFLARNSQALRELFGEARLPTLCQYDPRHRFFEAVDGELLFTGDGAVPLVRYRILDRGGVLSFEEMVEFCRAAGFDPLGSGRWTIRELPFVWVFGRDHFAVSIDGANVYPEQVSAALEEGSIAEAVTGKFVLQTTHDEGLDVFLACTVELLPDALPSTALADQIAQAIQSRLEQVNSEYTNYLPPARRTPRVILRLYRDPEYFPVGIKHRYTRPAGAT
jgi:phenylacetate-CoA ligase